MNNIKLIYPNERTKAVELMSGFKPLIDVNAKRQSNMVAVYRWFAVVACVSGLIALMEAASRLGWLS